MNRKEINEHEIDEAIVKLKEKLKCVLKEKGKGTFTSRHEILGIITEEYYELIDAVRSESNYNVSNELLDIAVGAIFGMVCIDSNNTDW